MIDLPAVGNLRAQRLTVTVGDDVKFSLRTRDGEVATVLRLHALAVVEKRWQAVRDGPATLSHKQLVALAGEVYRLVTSRFEENPGTPDDWAAFKAFNRALKEGRIASAPPIDLDRLQDASTATEVFGSDLTAGINALPATNDLSGLEARFGRLASWVLTLHGLDVDGDTRTALLKQIAEASQDAGWQLKRNAAGDYRPDPQAARFPEFATAKSITLSDLFDRWQRETKPAASTVTTWRGVVASLKKHLKHEDVGRLRAEDVVAWKDGLVAGTLTPKPLSPKTINDTYLTALRAMLNYAVSNKMLRENVATGIRVAAKRQAGTSKQHYTEEEIARLLKLSAAETLAARRWIPLLLATSGARVGEVAQLWAERVKKIDGVYVMELRPAEDGGTFKNEGSERTVPLHPAVIGAGFLDFVREKGRGPLFYGRSRRRDAARHASKGTANHLAAWIRSQGFNDPRKAPCHALRHRFKPAATRAGVADSVADFIQGHNDKSSAGTYRHFDIPMLADAVGRIPVPR
ncbi:hypothetical protein ACRBEV_25025 [Methylobacterium phyllosphaerae]